MKKSIFWAAAGLMALAACQQQQAGFTIQGTAVGAADGDTIYLQNFDGTNMVKLDSAVVKNGTFEFKGTPDSLVTSRFVTYMKRVCQNDASSFLLYNHWFLIFHRV